MARKVGTVDNILETLCAGGLSWPVAQEETFQSVSVPAKRIFIDAPSLKNQNRESYKRRNNNNGKRERGLEKRGPEKNPGL